LDAVVACGQGASAVDASPAHAIVAFIADGAHHAGLAIGATVDVCLVSVVNPIEAGGRGDTSAAAHVTGLLFAVGVAVAKAAYAAPIARATAVHVRLIAVLNPVSAARREADHPGSAEAAYAAGAVIGDAAPGAGAAVRAHRAATVAARLLTVGDLVLAVGFDARRIHAIEAAAVVGHFAARAVVAPGADTPTIHIRFAAVVESIVTSRRRCTPLVRPAGVRCAVIVEGASPADGAAVATETAAVQARLVTVDDLVVTPGSLANPSVPAEFADPAHAIVSVDTAQGVAARVAPASTVYVGLVAVLDAVVAARLRTFSVGA